MVTFHSYLAHPQSVCMSYAAHLRFSLRVAAHFFAASVAALVHAFVPSLCQTTTTTCVTRVSSMLVSAGCRPTSDCAAAAEAEVRKE